MAALEARDISKEYATRSGALQVLCGCAFSVERGESIAIVGPSGCGKSTLLNILGGLEPPTGGAVLVDGENPYTMSEEALSAFRNRRVGFVFQDHLLLPQCDVLENVLIPTLVRADRDELPARARALLDRVGLSQRLDHLPSELSGGERQRAAVARALINGPAVVLADEPTGNLDARSAEGVGDLLLELAQTENAVLVTVTHSSSLAARFKRRFSIHDGRLTPID